MIESRPIIILNSITQQKDYYLVDRAISETNLLHENMNEYDNVLKLIIGRCVTTLSKKK